MNAFQLDSNGSEFRIRLSGDVTIAEAQPLHSALVAAISADTTLAIDARDATRLDAAIVQLLLAAARAAARSHVEAGSPAWTHALARFGVAESDFLSPLIPRS
jgi:anti-anti-sigma regulatory factor